PSRVEVVLQNGGGVTGAHIRIHGGVPAHTRATERLRRRLPERRDRAGVSHRGGGRGSDAHAAEDEAGQAAAHDRRSLSRLDRKDPLRAERGWAGFRICTEWRSREELQFSEEGG